jgi:hypothetical protein
LKSAEITRRGALTVWLSVVIAAFLDWVARGLINPSVPARVFICFLILVGCAQAVAIAYYRDKSRKTSDPRRWRFDWKMDHVERESQRS